MKTNGFQETAMVLDSLTQRFLDGGRIDVKNKTIYDGTYCSGGYPEEGIGVCTDVVWRAFKHCGISLKDSVDAAIKKQPSKFYIPTGKPDGNIDFRRVKNLLIYFKEHAESLTTVFDTSTIETWQPGDIVCFEKPDHIAIISDKKAADGTPYIIHNSGPYARDANDLLTWVYSCTGHFRYSFK